MGLQSPQTRIQILTVATRTIFSFFLLIERLELEVSCHSQLVDEDICLLLLLPPHLYSFLTCGAAQSHVCYEFKEPVENT